MREYTRVVAVNIVCVNRQNPTFAAKLLGVNRGTVSDCFLAKQNVPQI